MKFQITGCSFKNTALVSFAALSLIALTSCTPVGLAVGAGATVGSASLEERGLGQAVDDKIVEASIAKALFDFNLDAFAAVNVEVVEGRVLLTGRVDDPDHRVEAVRLSWLQDGVLEVINEIDVGDESDWADRGKDAWIATQVRTAITLDKDIKAVNYSIEVVRGTVFLFGIAQDEKELNRVRAHVRTIESVRRIVSDHVRLKDDPARKAASLTQSDKA